MRIYLNHRCLLFCGSFIIHVSTKFAILYYYYIQLVMTWALTLAYPKDSDNYIYSMVHGIIGLYLNIDIALSLVHMPH